MSTLVTGVDFAVVPTKSFDTAVDFSANVLGLPCTARCGQMPGAEFETGNLTLAVLKREAIGAEFRQAAPIALPVEAYFVNPDGNQLILHHRYAPRAPSA